MKDNVKLRLALFGILALLLVSSSLIFFFRVYYFEDDTKIVEKNEKKDSLVAENIVKEEKITEINVLALGDNLLHLPVIYDAKTEDENVYDFKPIFENIEKEISEADISFINQETVTGGEEFGISGYPLFNSPFEVQRDLALLGFDVVNHATNHTLDKTGAIESALENWENYEDVNVVGVSQSQSDRNKIEIMNVEGIRIAFLAYTYGTNGIPVPEDKTYIVNLIDEEVIKNDIEKIKNDVDSIIVSIHWGEEYMHVQSEEQERLAQFLADTGEIDLVIGHHPHVIQPVDSVKGEGGNDMMVAYSLGNMISCQDTLDSLLGGMLEFNLIMKGKEVAVESVNVVPIVTYHNMSYRDFEIIPLADYNIETAKTHGRDFMRYESSIEELKSISKSVLGEYCSIE